MDNLQILEYNRVKKLMNMADWTDTDFTIGDYMIQDGEVILVEW